MQVVFPAIKKSVIIVSESKLKESRPIRTLCTCSKVAYVYNINRKCIKCLFVFVCGCEELLL